MTRTYVVGAGLGLLLGASVVVLGSPEVANGLPSVCTSGAPNVMSWRFSDGSKRKFENPNNWTPTGVPTAASIVCIDTTDTVVIDDSFVGLIKVDQVQMAGATNLEIHQGMGLWVNGTSDSVWAPGTSVDVTMGELGGTGTILAQGDVNFTSGQFGTFLTTIHNGGGQQPPTDPGNLVVSGHATLTNLGLAFSAGYGVTVASGGVFTLAPDAWVAADYGTSLTVQPGGTLDLTGDSDYEQGFAVSGQPLSVLTNNGLVRKSSGSGTSVVDATYGGTGQAEVQSGTLALPDNQQVGASVSPGKTLATGRCDSGGATCQATTDPAQDAMSVAFTVPAANAAPAAVRLQELGAAADAEQVGNEVLAHADGLSSSTAAPGRIDLRFSQADVMATPLSDVQVVHTTDAGEEVLLPDCVNGTLPAGLYSCVVRPVTRDSQNTFVTVLTTRTSRWHLRRDQPVENQGAPGVPQGLTVKQAAPFDGSALAVAWSAPGTEGAGPVTSYRVGLDGTTVATPAGTTAVLKDPGPGHHTVTVDAVNAAGHGTAVTTSLAVDDLSKPRKVDEVQGPKGGKLTAGARWKPPADAGGLAITGYKVAVFRKDGTRVDTEVVKAGKGKYLFRLKPGRYFLEVKARNGDGWGPWSKKTDLVRPR